MNMINAKSLKKHSCSANIFQFGIKQFSSLFCRIDETG